MAVTLSDTYTGTDGTSLADHDPDIGDVGSWEAMAFAAGGGTLGSDLEIQANHVRPANLNNLGSAYRNSTDPGADEYNVGATAQFRATAQANRVLVAYWRMTPTGTANADVDRYELLGVNTPSQEWVLRKVVSGTSTNLDSAAASLAGNQFVVTVQVRTGSMAVLVDGTPTLSSTDTEITQRGRVGIGASRGDSDQWLDNLSVESVSSSGITGTLAETQDDQTLAASGQIGYTGSLTVTQADQTLAASGTSGATVTGSLAVTQDAQTLAASGHLTLTGSIAVTQADQTLAASGAVGDVTIGNLAQTQSDNTLAASGQIGYTGSLAVTQADQVAAASGWMNASGQLATNQASQTLTASGTTFTPIGGMPGLIHGKPPMPGAVEITVKSILGGIT